MELTFAAATDVGRQRTHNEDNFLIDKKLRLFLVADGMGGHAAGAVASSPALATTGATGSACSASTWPGHGASRLAEASRLSGRAEVIPGCRDRNWATSRTSLSVSTFSRGSTWTVTSLAISRIQAEADWFIM